MANAKSKQPPLNTKLLLAVKQEILDEPRRFAMSVFMGHAHGEREVDFPLKPQCNTVMCIGGWGIYLNAKLDAQSEKFSSTEDVVFAFDTAVVANDVAGTAQSILGLPNIALLYEDHWPAELYSRYTEAESEGDWETMAATAAKAIDAIIAGNGNFTHKSSETGEQDAS